MNWRRWLRLGPSEVETLEAELIAARAEIVSLKKESSVLNARENKALWFAFEPAQGDECKKTRLHTIAEGEAFRIKVAEYYSLSPDAFRIYRCKVCPRHPATGSRYIHIGNRTHKTEIEKQVNRKTARVARGGVKIEDSLSPEDIAKLRERFK